MWGVCIITRLYTHDLHIRITEDQRKFIANDVKTDYSQFIRNLIDVRKKTHNKALSILEAEFALVEPKYFSLLQRIEEIKTETNTGTEAIKPEETQVTESE